MTLWGLIQAPPERYDYTTILGGSLTEIGSEYIRNRVGRYFLFLFPFLCIYPSPNYKYIVAEQISLTEGLSILDPETLRPFVSKGFLRLLSASQHATPTSPTPFFNTSRYSP
jgi:hypothetical protein